MIGALAFVGVLALLFGVAAWIADRTQPDEPRERVDQSNVVKIGEWGRSDV